jgi:hypothetical protein
VAVAGVGAAAGRITSKDAWPEALLVLLSIPTLSCAATLLLGLLAVLGATPGGGEVGAPGD